MIVREIALRAGPPPVIQSKIFLRSRIVEFELDPRAARPLTGHLAGILGNELEGPRWMDAQRA